MADIEKVKRRIAEIAQKRNNVTDSEIEWVVNQLKLNGFKVRKPRKTTHGILYGINSVRFSICVHHSGKQLKPAYVGVFLNAMIELGLYEE
jgi:hypothetical protein